MIVLFTGYRLLVFWLSNFFSRGYFSICVFLGSKEKIQLWKGKRKEKKSSFPINVCLSLLFFFTHFFSPIFFLFLIQLCSTFFRHFSLSLSLYIHSILIVVAIYIPREFVYHDSETKKNYTIDYDDERVFFSFSLYYIHSMDKNQWQNCATFYSIEFFVVVVEHSGGRSSIDILTFEINNILFVHHMVHTNTHTFNLMMIQSFLSIL